MSVWRENGRSLTLLSVSVVTVGRRARASKEPFSLRFYVSQVKRDLPPPTHSS